MTSACLFLVHSLWLVQSAAEPPAIGFERWEATIARFEEQDRQSPPPAGGILFVGSSSIRLWKTDKWFPNHPVLNRGFGGSEIADVNHFAERIVLKYQPRAIVFYAGDNDVAKGKSADRVAEDFKKFAELVAERLPETDLIYLPIKPSPSRWKLWPDARAANAKIEQYLATRPRCRYADIATPMLGSDGQPRAELFAADRLHLNEAGYQLWTEIMQREIDRGKPAGSGTP
jgi:lysophospholipase L1-like esterase